MQNMYTIGDFIISQDTKIESVDNTDIQNILASIFQSSYDGIYVADKNGNGMMVNHAYSRVTGVKSQELLGKNMKTVVKEGLVSESVTMKVLDGKAPKTIIQTVRGKELLVTGNPVYDKNGEIAYVVTNVRDITDLNHMKTELQNSINLTQKYLNEIEELKKRKCCI